MNYKVTHIVHAKPKPRKPIYINYGETKKEIDKGWARFWAKRGFVSPPNVSTYQVGCFILPNPK